MSQHVAGSRLTSNIKITLKIKFTSEIFADITRSLVVLLQHLRFCKKILILIFFPDLFSVECKFFCPNSADNTMENRAISLVESSRDNSLISCPTSTMPLTQMFRCSLISLSLYCITTHFTDMCIPHFFLASERRSTVDVRRRPGYKIWRLFKFSSILLSFKTRH